MNIYYILYIIYILNNKNKLNLNLCQLFIHTFICLYDDMLMKIKLKLGSINSIAW